jgi:signal peptidase II
VNPRLFYTIAGLIVLCDQVTKRMVLQSLPVGESRRILGPILSLTHTRNAGGAFSLLQARAAVFVIVGVIAVIAMVIAFHRLRGAELPIATALALALGGAVGNLIDRIRFGYVVDFFDVHVWPIFNIADSAITVAICLLAWRFLVVRHSENDPAKGGPS